MLDKIQSTLTFKSKKQYQQRLKTRQLKLLDLQRKLHKKGIPVIIVFEGWDAAGKGGVIRRLTESLDPRGYIVQSISAPDSHEKQYHYFRRFWKTLPKKGQISIFDRSWYGRVLVERVEELAKPNEWKRAYDEINAVEKMFVDDEQLLIKFWIQITKEEQLKRFEERKSNPFKQWKLTDEDWRNRGKWDEYVTAVEDMIMKTSTEWAPWHLINGNDKWSARIAVLDIVIYELEQRLAAKSS